MADAIGLVADIGRTSVRFALTGVADGAGLREQRSYLTADHATFTSALLGYLAAVGLTNALLPSVLAVAGLTRGDTVNVTGSRWYVSLSGVEAVLRVRPRALNECAANALALTRLEPGDMTALSGAPVPTIVPGGRYLVLAPGAGLGVSALVTQGDRLIPVETEAGHVAFAARTEAEQQVVAHLARRNVAVSNEALVSAAGLANIHAALTGDSQAGIRADEITGAAAHDPLAGRTLDVFIEALGAVIGDYVLAFGAWDGVFLTGALMRALRPRLSHPALRRRLEAKDAFKRQLGQLPIAVVKRNGLELLGAAAALAGR